MLEREIVKNIKVDTNHTMEVGVKSEYVRVCKFSTMRFVKKMSWMEMERSFSNWRVWVVIQIVGNGMEEEMILINLWTSTPKLVPFSFHTLLIHCPNQTQHNFVSGITIIMLITLDFCLKVTSFCNCRNMWIIHLLCLSFTCWGMRSFMQWRSLHQMLIF